MTVDHMYRVSDIGGTLLSFLQHSVRFWKRHHEDLRPRYERVQTLKEATTQLSLELGLKQRSIRELQRATEELEARRAEQEQLRTEKEMTLLLSSAQLQRITQVLLRFQTFRNNCLLELQSLRTAEPRLAAECLLEAAAFSYLSSLPPQDRRTRQGAHRSALRELGVRTGRRCALHRQDLWNEMKFEVSEKPVNHIVKTWLDYSLNTTPFWTIVIDPHQMVSSYLPSFQWTSLPAIAELVSPGNHDSVKEHPQTDEHNLLVRLFHHETQTLLSLLEELLHKRQGHQLRLCAVLQDSCCSIVCPLCSSARVLNLALEDKALIHSWVRTHLHHAAGNEDEELSLLSAVHQHEDLDILFRAAKVRCADTLMAQVTPGGCVEAVDALDAAVIELEDCRSKLGAMEKRLVEETKKVHGRCAPAAVTFVRTWRVLKRVQRFLYARHSYVVPSVVPDRQLFTDIFIDHVNKLSDYPEHDSVSRYRSAVWSAIWEAVEPRLQPTSHSTTLCCLAVLALTNILDDEETNASDYLSDSMANEVENQPTSVSPRDDMGEEELIKLHDGSDEESRLSVDENGEEFVSKRLSKLFCDNPLDFLQQQSKGSMTSTEVPNLHEQGDKKLKRSASVGLSPSSKKLTRLSKTHSSLPLDGSPITDTDSLRLLHGSGAENELKTKSSRSASFFSTSLTNGRKSFSSQVLEEALAVILDDGIPYHALDFELFCSSTSAHNRTRSRREAACPKELRVVLLMQILQHRRLHERVAKFAAAVMPCLQSSCTFPRHDIERLLQRRQRLRSHSLCLPSDAALVEVWCPDGVDGVEILKSALRSLGLPYFKTWFVLVPGVRDFERTLGRLLELSVSRSQVHVVLIDTPPTMLPLVRAAVQRLDAASVRHANVIVLVAHTQRIHGTSSSSLCPHTVVLREPLVLSHYLRDLASAQAPPKSDYCKIDFLESRSVVSRSPRPAALLSVSATLHACIQWLAREEKITTFDTDSVDQLVGIVDSVWKMYNDDETACSSLEELWLPLLSVLWKLIYLHATCSAETRIKIKNLLHSVRMVEDCACSVAHGSSGERARRPQLPNRTSTDANSSACVVVEVQIPDLATAPLQFTIPLDLKDIHVCSDAAEFSPALPPHPHSTELPSLCAVTLTSSAATHLLTRLRDDLPASTVTVSGEAAQDFTVPVNLVWRQEAKILAFHSQNAVQQLNDILQQMVNGLHSPVSAFVDATKVVEDLSRKLCIDVGYQPMDAPNASEHSDAERQAPRSCGRAWKSVLAEQTLPCMLRLIEGSYKALRLSSDQLQHWATSTFVLPKEKDIHIHLLTRPLRWRLLRLAEYCRKMHIPLSFDDKVIE
ncbi:hypothetical protein FHG87_010796 [Trinorchestia longiramus]|nr:hypothetical protein FHG87_010796 [Trinorchestia longiramus]